MLYFQIFLLISAAFCAVYNGVGNPPKPVLWISNILLCVLVALLMFGK